jgi:hypothetical protein
MSSTLKYTLIVFFCFLAVGCTSNNNDDIHLPSPLSIPESMLNKDLRVAAPVALNDFKKEDLITLDITLVTDNQIVTSPDFNAEMYIYDNSSKEWKRIENLVKYETPPDEIFMKQGDSDMLTLFPDFSQFPASLNKVLILVSGNIVENDQRTNKMIGTYIILDLEP